MRFVNQLAYISCSCSVCAKLSGRTMSPSSAIPSKPARSTCYSHHTAFHHAEPTHALKITVIACGPMEIQTAVLSCPNSFSTKSFQLYIAAKNKCNDHYGETDRNITWMIRRQFIQCQFYPHSSQQGDTHSQLSHRKRGGERRVRYLICPLFGHPSPLLINCKCSNWQQLLGSQIKQMNENYTSFRSASLLHNHTVPAALERENRNLACVTDLTRWHLNEISWQFQLDCLSTPQAALWENGTEAHNKVAGNDNLTQDTTVSINGKALWAKHAWLTTLWPSCWPVLHL